MSSNICVARIDAHTGVSGPSSLTLIAQFKDSRWRVDLFRFESLMLRSDWVLVVTDVATRRFIGFGVAREHVDFVIVCRMLTQSFADQHRPKHTSPDRESLFRFPARSPTYAYSRSILLVPYAIH